MEIYPSLPHYSVRQTLAELHADNLASHQQIASLLHWPTGENYATDLNAVVAQLRRLEWWWHLSHIQATVIPTRDADGPLAGLMSNSAKYDREGHPIQYLDSFAREQPALSLCRAAIKATYDLPDAFYVNASHSQEVLSRVPKSTEYMMSYYRAREESRQEAIAAWNTSRLLSPPPMEG